MPVRLICGQRFEFKGIPSKSKVTPEELANGWSILYEWSKLVQTVWPSIWSIPLSGSGSVYEIVASRGEAGTLLEIGAGRGDLRPFLNDRRPDIQYFSLDIDRNQRHDFYEWGEVRGNFSAIAGFEVIEHVDPLTAYNIYAQAFEHLDTRGLLMVSTPNVFHANRWLQDPTHVTPWAYARLCASLLALGFDIQAVYRIADTPVPIRAWRDRVAFRLEMMLRKRMGIDFSDTICVVASKSNLVNSR